VVSVLAYTLLFAGSGNIARNILGDQATEEQIAAKQAELGLDQPLLTQLGDWMSHAVQLDFGRSWFTSQPVFEAIGSRLMVTLVMVFASVAIIAVLATVLGVAAAVRRGWIDRVVQVGAVAGSALPGFIIGVFLVTIFAVQLGWFDSTSQIRPGSSPGVWLTSLSLPVIRSAFIKQLEQDYVRTLRSRGISEREVLFKHVLRSAAPAGLTVLSLQFIGLLGGVVVIESIFAIPGMGKLAVDATTQSDLPLVMGVVTYTVIIVIVVNLLVDILNGWLNPKVRVS
jgi:peptide/nickel transport system permease protein